MESGRNLLTDGGGSPTDRNAHGPVAGLCFPEALVRQKEREDCASLAVFWTHGVQRGRPVSMAWCLPGSLQLTGGPGGRRGVHRGVHRGEGTRTEGSKGVTRACHHL